VIGETKGQRLEACGQPQDGEQEEDVAAKRLQVRVLRNSGGQNRRFYQVSDDFARFRASNRAEPAVPVLAAGGAVQCGTVLPGSEPHRGRISGPPPGPARRWPQGGRG